MFINLNVLLPHSRQYFFFCLISYTVKYFILNTSNSVIGNKSRLINDKLEILIPEKYSEILPLENLYGIDKSSIPDNIFVVGVNSTNSYTNKLGLYDIKKGEIIPTTKNNIYRIKGDKLLVENEDKTYSIYNLVGSVYTTKKYDKIEVSSDENKIIVKCILNGKIDLIEL